MNKFKGCQFTYSPMPKERDADVYICGLNSNLKHKHNKQLLARFPILLDYLKVCDLISFKYLRALSLNALNSSTDNEPMHTKLKQYL